MVDYIDALRLYICARKRPKYLFHWPGIYGWRSRRGSSAFDNAAQALDAGQSVASLLPPRLAGNGQVMSLFTDCLRHLGDMDDERRWRFMQYVLGLRESFPQDAYDRCTSYSHFEIRTGKPWLDPR